MNAVLLVLGESSLRAAAIAVAVFAVLRMLRVKSPTILHRAWTGVLAAMLLLPAFSLWAPRIALPVLPPMPAATGIVDVPVISNAVSWPGEFIPVQAAAIPEGSTAGRPARPAGTGAYRPTAPEIVIAIYLVGLVVLLGRLVVGMALAVRLARGASRRGPFLHSTRCRAPLR
jgi:hypothetical protein